MTVRLPCSGGSMLTARAMYLHTRCHARQGSKQCLIPDRTPKPSDGYRCCGECGGRLHTAFVAKWKILPAINAQCTHPGRLFVIFCSACHFRVCSTCHVRVHAWHMACGLSNHSSLTLLGTAKGLQYGNNNMLEFAGITQTYTTNRCSVICIIGWKRRHRRLYRRIRQGQYVLTWT